MVVGREGGEDRRQNLGSNSSIHSFTAAFTAAHLLLCGPVPNRPHRLVPVCTLRVGDPWLRWPLITSIMFTTSFVSSVIRTLWSFLSPWLPLFSLLPSSLCPTKASVFYGSVTNIFLLFFHPFSQGNFISSQVLNKHFCVAVFQIYIYSPHHSQVPNM